MQKLHILGKNKIKCKTIFTLIYRDILKKSKIEGLDATPPNFFCELFIYDIILKKKMGAQQPALRSIFDLIYWFRKYIKPYIERKAGKRTPKIFFHNNIMYKEFTKKISGREFQPFNF